VTPPVGGHPLIWVTPVATVEDPLLAKGVVLDQGDRRFVLCAVDVALGKYNDRTRRARDELTDRLYAGMEAAAAATRYFPAEWLRWQTVPVRFPERTDPGHRLEDNRAKMADPEGNVIARIRAATRVAFTERIDQPIDVNLLEIGPARVLLLPGECMIEFQLYAQGLLPSRFVAVATCGDCVCGYICTEAAFAEGGYEPTDSFVTPQSEAALKAAIREVLGVEQGN